jgi:predicted acylesterase/phospholipase RssA
MLAAMLGFRVPFVGPVLSLATLTLGCAFLLPDRIHWTVEPDASNACAEATPTRIIGVALSGGGSRAAVYAAAGLEALWEHGLLDQVSHLSSVSGGSIAAAYFAVNHPHCDAEATPSAAEACWRRFFSEFKRAMRYDYAWATERQQALYPNRWLSPTRRASSFQEVLDREFLDGATFEALRGSGASSSPEGSPQRPALLINAASYDEARRFVFSNLCIGNQTDATRSASFSRPGCPMSVPGDLPVSLAVTASAAFPGMFGPVALEVPPSCDVSHPEWWHLGDGGMLDNLGADTLEEAVLEAADAGGLSTAAILAFDADQRLRADHLKRMSNYTLLERDPNRIVVVTKARGSAHHDVVWDRARLELADRGVRADRIVLRYMAADLERWPASCRREARRSAGSTASQVEGILDRLEAIPTLLSIDDCGADLLELAAHQVVHASLNGEPGERLRELGIAFRAASD